MMSTNSGTFVVIAEFSISNEHRSEFLTECSKDATSSMKDEKGCRSFEVLNSEEDANVIVLYEIYDDKAAFDTHRETPHFAVFAAALERLGATRTQLRFFTHL
jgi:quinol monooxygenase YgiN